MTAPHDPEAVEALATALATTEDEWPAPSGIHWWPSRDEFAAALAAALPPGWRLTRDDDLSAAWAAAADAKPHGWLGPSLYQLPSGDWRAYAVAKSVARPMPNMVDGPHPAAALRALAAKLGDDR